MMSVSPTTGRPQLMSRALAEDIGTRILSGEYPSGTVLSPDEMLRAYRVSRTCLREAIVSLTARGLLTAKPNHGTRVAPISDWNLLDPQILAWSPTDGWLAQAARKLFGVLATSEDLMFLHVAGEPLAVHLMKVLGAVPGWEPSDDPQL